MAKNNSKDIIFFLGIFIIVLVLSFLIIKPFLASILAALILAYLFYPLNARLQKAIGNKAVSSLAITILILIIFCIPFLLLINAASQSMQSIKVFNNAMIANGIYQGCQNQTSFICSIADNYYDIISHPTSQYVISHSIEAANSAALKMATGFLLSLPAKILALFVMFFIIYYSLKEGPKIADDIKKIMPINRKYSDSIIKKCSEVIYAVIYGNIVICIIQGFAAFLGFWMLGFRSPVILGVATAFAALIPVVGTGIVWLPAASFKIINGILLDQNDALVKGIIMLLYGAIIVSSIDNILRPKIIGSRTTLHPVLILLGILGGAIMFGVIGIIIGPIILSVLLIFLSVYKKEMGIK